MCGVFAEFERSMIVERVNAGLARAKANGVKLGRGNRKDNKRSADEKRWGMSRAELEKRILRLRKQDMGLVPMLIRSLLYANPCRRRGSRTVNSVKSPTSLSTVIVPPCCWVMIS